MLDPAQLSEEEKALLAEVAEAKGQPIEEVLRDLGHENLVTAGDTVSLEGATEDSPEDSPEVASSPITVTEEEPATSLEVPDTPPPIEPPPPLVEEPEKAEEPEEPEEPEETDGSLRRVCTHCGWDQEEPVIAEPAAADKLAFLHSILGGASFTKRFSMFGDNLRVTFRTLTIKEVDKLYEETYTAQKSGVISTTSDYYEHLNRLRLHLQLVSVEGKSVALHHKLPMSLSAATNKLETETWETFLKEKNIFDEEQGLVSQMQGYILDNVLTTEQLLRTVTHECQKFNRLAAKLEARVDDSDFWKETDQPS
jgi:hypothetical protein